MRIYLPTDEPETWEMRSGAQVHLLPTTDGWVELPPVGQSELHLVRKGQIIARTRAIDLARMEQTVHVDSIETGLQHVNFHIVNKTQIFYADDKQIITLCNFNGLEVTTPITISWYLDKSFIFGVLANVPAPGSPGHGVKYVHGMALTPATPKGSWTGTLRLLTGKELGRVELTLLPRNRGNYVYGTGPFRSP